MEEGKVTVELTKTQVNIILGLIDCHTPSGYPDFVLGDHGKVVSPMLGCEEYRESVQEHLDRFLTMGKLDF